MKMKSIVLMMLIFSSSAFAANITLETECFKELDKLDRDYCHGKRMKLYNKMLASEKAGWTKNLTQDQKNKSTLNITNSIMSKEAQVLMLQDEIKALKAHNETLASAKIIVPKKKKKEKKKNDLEKALGNLGIKL